MSGVSIVVLGLSFQGSRQGQLAATRPALAGVVGNQPSSLSGALPSVAKAAPRLAGTHPPTRLLAATHAPTPHPAATHLPTPHRTATHAPAAPAAAAAPASVTVNGISVDTQYGPVQVQITLRAGHVVRADAIDYPHSGGRDQEINSQAIPQLDREAVRAGTAQIDTVSGATFTSDGYRQSLQSALDAAHRAGA
jgi:uncharacterized protein with FMN-binding domain